MGEVTSEERAQVSLRGPPIFHPGPGGFDVDQYCRPTPTFFATPQHPPPSASINRNSQLSSTLVFRDPQSPRYTTCRSSTSHHCILEANHCNRGPSFFCFLTSQLSPPPPQNLPSQPVTAKTFFFPLFFKTHNLFRPHLQPFYHQPSTTIFSLEILSLENRGRSNQVSITSPRPFILPALSHTPPTKPSRAIVAATPLASAIGYKPIFVLCVSPPLILFHLPHRQPHLTGPSLQSLFPVRSRSSQLCVRCPSIMSLSPTSPSSPSPPTSSDCHYSSCQRNRGKPTSCAAPAINSPPPASPSTWRDSFMPAQLESTRSVPHASVTLDHLPQRHQFSAIPFRRATQLTSFASYTS